MTVYNSTYKPFGKKCLAFTAIFLSCLALLFAFSGCTEQPEQTTKVNTLPPMYPDYTNVTIPKNIAPLNFLVRQQAEATCLLVNGKVLASSRDNAVSIDEDDWHALLQQWAGKNVDVSVCTKQDGKWTEYRHFQWTIAKDTIDPYLTYRLIEPDYEVYNRLELRERCIENFEERAICTHQIVGNRCMNCHNYNRQDPNTSMMYVRGEGGGAILNQNGQLRKLDIKTPDMVSGSVYFSFNPSGRYLAFSTNKIIPAFHSNPDKRLEVFDAKSDVYVADLQTNTIVRSPLLADSTVYETFPTFSPDGKYVYFCSAPKAKGIYQLQYDLCRIEFDQKAGQFGTKVDTIVSLRNAPMPDKHSVCHPRISPDGRFLLYTVAAYGTFPIWHTEADLQMMDLKTGAIDTLAGVNSQKSDTYHCWSSNSRWFVFASKRDDGLYGKPYFCYVDKRGKAHKPFVLPQANPHFYDNNLTSFNIPELGRGKLPFSASDVEKAMTQQAEAFK